MNALKLSDEPRYSIGLAAGQLGLSVHTLRKYEFHGLVLPHRNGGGQRRYSDGDLDRIRCIHSAINEQKIGIEGIKRMLALVPCWVLIKCSDADRAICPAYQGSEGPCWLMKHKDSVCGPMDCRSCSVYQEAGTCHSLKDLLRATLA